MSALPGLRDDDDVDVTSFNVPVFIDGVPYIQLRHHKHMLKTYEDALAKHVRALERIDNELKKLFGKEPKFPA